MFRNIQSHVPRETIVTPTYSVGDRGLQFEVTPPLPDFREFSLPNLQAAGLVSPVSPTVIHDPAVADVASLVVDHLSNSLTDSDHESQG